MIETIGSGLTFWIYALVNVFAFLFVWLLLPETSGKSLEMMKDVFTQSPSASASLSKPWKMLKKGKNKDEQAHHHHHHHVKLSTVDGGGVVVDNYDDERLLELENQ